MGYRDDRFSVRDRQYQADYNHRQEIDRRDYHCDYRSDHHSDYHTDFHRNEQYLQQNRYSYDTMDHSPYHEDQNSLDRHLSPYVTNRLVNVDRPQYEAHNSHLSQQLPIPSPRIQPRINMNNVSGAMSPVITPNNPAIPDMHASAL